MSQRRPDQQHRGRQRQGQERQTLILTVIFTFVLAGFTLLSSGGDWVATLLVIPLVATASYWSLKLSMRFSRRWAPPPPEPHAATPPSTERPEHVRRRRERRRPRGRNPEH